MCLVHVTIRKRELWILVLSLLASCSLLLHWSISGKSVAFSYFGELDFGSLDLGMGELDRWRLSCLTLIICSHLCLLRFVWLSFGLYIPSMPSNSQQTTRMNRPRASRQNEKRSPTGSVSFIFFTSCIEIDMTYLIPYYFLGNCLQSTRYCLWLPVDLNLLNFKAFILHCYGTVVSLLFLQMPFCVFVYFFCLILHACFSSPLKKRNL